MFEASAVAASNAPCVSDTVFPDAACVSDTAVAAVSDILRSSTTVDAVFSDAYIFSDAGVFSDVPIFSDTVAAMVSDVSAISDFVWVCLDTVPSVSPVKSEICTFAMSSPDKAVFTSSGLPGSVKVSSSCGVSSTSILEMASSNA